MKSFIRVLIIITLQKSIECTIDGLSYLDPLKFRRLEKKWPRGEDPCNPLYWYPREIPEYCYRTAPPPLRPAPAPVPVPADPPPYPIPVPIPVPPPLPIGIPIIPSNPMLPVGGFPFPPIPQYPYLQPAYPQPGHMEPALPQPALPQPALPHPAYPPPFPLPMPPYNRKQVGMVPGIPGIVSSDGGINILPFSDAYSDLLRNYKEKKLKKRLRKLFAKYGVPKREWI